MISKINKGHLISLSVIICQLSFGTMLTSCVEDDGSYDYVDLPEITIEDVPEVTEVLAYADDITLSPRFVSSTEGEISPSDPNYTVQYRFGHKGMGSMGMDYENQKNIVWEDVTPAQGFNVSFPANYSTGAYQIWITLTDNRNNSVTSKQFDINILSATYEGWMVLCNEGAEERARLDMISKLPGGTVRTVHDIAAGLPNVHHATDFIVWTQDASPGDQSYIFTREGSYELDPESFETDAVREFNLLQFVFDPGETIIKKENFAGPYYDWTTRYQVCFGEKGNAYIFKSGTYGAAFSLPVNTLVEGEDPQFHVAPACGYSWVRPWSADYGENILFYDTDNRRFLIYDGTLERLQLNVIPEPSGDEVNLFSYTTGKDFVYMQSTRRSNGLVYTILQDPATGKRSIYGINLGGSGYAQELYLPDVAAPEFEQATQFAFDNRFPLLFYSAGANLYCYNFATNQTTPISTGLASGEEITMLRFNLYLIPNYDNLANQTEEFMNQQYRLIVGSYDGSINGGKVTFFDVDGVSSTATPAEQYTGFGKVVKVLYRERSV